jgi:hypothetical protein
MNFNQSSTVLVLTKMIFNHKITQNCCMSIWGVFVIFGIINIFINALICLLVIYSYILIKQAIIITLVNL